MNTYEKVISWFTGGDTAEAAVPEIIDEAPEQVDAIAVNNLPSASWNTRASAVNTNWDGDKFAGGFGATQIFSVDYWTLRKRSAELFTRNLYARGVIRRLITNDINTGLQLEALPDEAILGLEEGELDDWVEDVEARFHLWAKTRTACDEKKTHTWYELQAEARQEALVGGDVLVVLRQNRITRLPMVLLIKGENVRQPTTAEIPRGTTVQYGVELDSAGRHVAYWVRGKDNKHTRIPAVGQKTKRRTAWLMYGSDKRMGEVRGQPFLSILLQSLKDMDRYRDSAITNAVAKSIIALFIKKNSDKPGTKPLTAGATAKVSVEVADDTQSSGTRQLNVQSNQPGLYLEELQEGEEPVGFMPNVDVDLGKFEDIIISAVAWSSQIPPEILKLSFNSNYSASQAATNEFKMYLNYVRTTIGNQFCSPIYEEWLLSSAIADRIGNSMAILEAWADKVNFEQFAAWSLSDWAGAIKPSIDIVKQANGYGMLLDRGWITNSRASREITGMKFARIARTLRREQKLLNDLGRGQSDPQAGGGGGQPTQALNITEILSKIDDIHDDVQTR